MKCPKCGYTSFDHLDDCKRCGTDLRDARTLLQIIAVSPEERVPGPAAVGEDPYPDATAPEPPPMDDDFLSAPAGADLSAGRPAAEEDDFLGTLDFEESFDGLVERTSYDDAPAPDAPAAAAEDPLDALSFPDEEPGASMPALSLRRGKAPDAETAGDDGDDLLELDFGDLFEDNQAKAE